MLLPVELRDLLTLGRRKSSWNAPYLCHIGPSPTTSLKSLKARGWATYLFSSKVGLSIYLSLEGYLWVRWKTPKSNCLFRFLHILLFPGQLSGFFGLFVSATCWSICGWLKTPSLLRSTKLLCSQDPPPLHSLRNRFFLPASLACPGFSSDAVSVYVQCRMQPKSVSGRSCGGQGGGAGGRAGNELWNWGLHCPQSITDPRWACLSFALKN